MKHPFNRRDFLKNTAIIGASLGLAGSFSNLYAHSNPAGKRVGIIGLDTSHSVAFTKTLNKANADVKYKGYKVVAAYPQGSKDIETSTKRVPGYTKDVKKLGVEIVNSIDDLLTKVDVVLLESNDGRVHLEQALPVLKAGKRMFIDKPIAASLKDAVAIFDAAEKHKTPIFSSSSLRYMDGVKEVLSGKVGNVIGADTYSPALIERTHPDLLWYGIHGIEILFSVMGTGCKSVTRTYSDDTDIVIGVWNDGRIGTFRGTRTGAKGYGGTVYGDKAILPLGKYGGYDPLLLEIVQFFETGVPPVSREETMEIVAFAEAADRSRSNGGMSVELDLKFK